MYARKVLLAHKSRGPFLAHKLNGRRLGKPRLYQEERGGPSTLVHGRESQANNTEHSSHLRPFQQPGADVAKGSGPYVQCLKLFLNVPVVWSATKRVFDTIAWPEKIAKPPRMHTDSSGISPTKSCCFPVLWNTTQAYMEACRERPRCAENTEEKAGAAPGRGREPTDTEEGSRTFLVGKLASFFFVSASFHESTIRKPRCSQQYTPCRPTFSAKPVQC